MKILKSTATKKVTVCFYSLGEEKSKEKKNIFRNISNFNHAFVWIPSKVERSLFEQIARFL